MNGGAFDHGCEPYGFDIQGRCRSCGEDFSDEIEAVIDAADRDSERYMSQFGPGDIEYDLVNGGCKVAFVTVGKQEPSPP